MRSAGRPSSRSQLPLLALMCLVTLSALPAKAAPQAEAQKPASQASPTSPLVDHVLQLLSPGAEERERAAGWLAAHWNDEAIPMLIEVQRFLADPSTTQQVVELLQHHTGERYGRDLGAWRHWLWNREPFTPKGVSGSLAEFKMHLYASIDPRFDAYFSPDHEAKIRLDEVVWGGVKQDGIPPLRYPEMVSPAQAKYLADSDIVFGIAVGGDLRAYPKRILGWHEMFVDKIGGVPVVGVYCTLCGSMIVYETTYDGVNHELGTSGFLFRSNKLMYDRATQSLWNTLWGRPVVGPLAAEDIQLKRRPIVTTTWGEWRRRHPQTRVLSRNTGHRRDYREGAAYRKYYATDRLMFGVPKLDKRMKNKAEVLALSFEASDAKPLAISAGYLRQHPLYQSRAGALSFAVLTDGSGANRVYERKDVTFTSWDGDQTLVDETGREWELGEDEIRSPDGRSLQRLPAHRAFWFAWYSAHPDTRLVQ